MKVVNVIEEFLEPTDNLYCNGRVVYNDRVDYCGNGYHAKPNTTFRLRQDQMFMEKAVGEIENSTFKGADPKIWRY